MIASRSGLLAPPQVFWSFFQQAFQNSKLKRLPKIETIPKAKKENQFSAKACKVEFVPVRRQHEQQLAVPVPLTSGLGSGKYVYCLLNWENGLLAREKPPKPGR
eukprot:TRINITY_DN589_c0_g1_i12.p1 TRINITY_DN589_c0_g1~~TRINITY_DN589_c0_g1_i12.p1  ORF type:complete len:104 (+),score=19.40 TRINITY_DN589_c0_g1_i12:867-1178(+)